MSQVIVDGLLLKNNIEGTNLLCRWWHWVNSCNIHIIAKLDSFALPSGNDCFGLVPPENLISDLFHRSARIEALDECRLGKLRLSQIECY